MKDTNPKTCGGPLAALLAAAALSPLPAEAQFLINDDMESYTTATPTSVRSFGEPDPSDPPGWGLLAFGSNPPTEFTGGITTGANGSRAAVLRVDLNGVGFGSGAEVWSAPYAAAPNRGHGLADFHFSLDFQIFPYDGRQHGARLMIFSLDENLQLSGHTQRLLWNTLPSDAYGHYEGSLADVQWYENGYWGPLIGTLELDAPYYQWVIALDNPYATGNTVPGGEWEAQFDNFKLWAGDIAVPEPHEYGMLAGVGLLGFTLWRRRTRA